MLLTTPRSSSDGGGSEAGPSGPGIWTSVVVPSSWVLDGHGIPIYTNVQYPFDTSAYPEVGLPDESADYWRTFEVPSSWAGCRIVLRIGAAESCVEVWVDGLDVGFSTDSRLPAEFDITQAVTPGRTSTIGLRVHRWSASTWLEDQDMWWMAGIHRSVLVYATEQAHLSDAVVVTTALAGDHSRAELAVAVDIGGGGPAGAERVELDLIDPTGAVLVSALALEPGESGSAADPIVRRCRGRLVVPAPALWTAETPLCHDLELRLLAGDGAVIDRRRLTVGIRTVEVGGGALRVNGSPITIRGVNRHEHDPVLGRVQTDEMLATDIGLLKAANVNAIRTSHYPNDERFYELCNRHGFYVIDEANLETHGLVGDPRLPADDKRFEAAFVARGERMVRRDRNHPSIVAWSLGNESGFGRGHRLMADVIRALDPTRPIHYHPAESDEVVDIVAPMYPSLAELASLAAVSDDRPVIMCEYSHAMGNSTGGLEEYWELIRAHPRLGGGFIWDWVDQGIARTTPEGTTWWAYGGDFGDEPNDGIFICTGLVAPDRRPHPGLLHVAWVYRPVAVVAASRQPGLPAALAVRVENRHDHLGLDHLALVWTVWSDGVEVAAGRPDTPLALGPGASTGLTVALPALDPAAHHHQVRFEWRAVDGGPGGLDGPGLPPLYQGLVAWDEVVVPAPVPLDRSPVIHTGPPAGRPPSPSPEVSRPSATTGAADVGIDVGRGDVTLSAGGSSVTLDSAGRPRTLVLAGREIPLAGARLGVWRAPTDNDEATFGDSRVGHRLRRAGVVDGNLEPQGKWIGAVDSDGVASATLVVGIGSLLRIRCRWLVDPSGDVAFDLQATGDLDTPPILRLGYELDLPQRFQHIDWFGPGPIESYPDRVGGLFVGRHRGLVADQLANYARPQESGNHTAVRWLALTDGSGAGLVAVGDPRFDAAAVPVAAAALMAATHPHEVIGSDTMVLRLDAAHSGLGTASCGPGVLAPYELLPRTGMANRIILRPVEPGSPGLPVGLSPLRRHQRWRYGGEWQ